MKILSLLVIPISVLIVSCAHNGTQIVSNDTRHPSADSDLGKASAPIPQKSFEPKSLLIFDEQSLTAPDILTADQVQYEIDLLMYALSNGYGGRKHLPGHIFESALKRIGGITGPLTPRDLKDKIDSVLFEIPDNHLKARINGEPSPIRRSNTLAGSVGSNAISKKEKVWEVRLDDWNGKKILYISVTRFPSYKDLVWQGFIDQAMSRFTVADVMVVDFRGNTGGDDTMGYDLASAAIGHTYNHPINRAYVSQTPETFILYANQYRFSKVRLKSEGKIPPPYLDELAQEKLNKYQLALAGKIPDEETVVESPVEPKFSANKGFDKPIFILIDEECVSSCESSTDAFESYPKVKKVGAATRGMIHYGNVGVLLLPISKIHVQIPTKTNEYFDKRFIEKIGIKPDTLVPTGQDAYKFLREKVL